MRADESFDRPLRRAGLRKAASLWLIVLQGPVRPKWFEARAVPILVV